MALAEQAVAKVVKPVLAEETVRQVIPEAQDVAAFMVVVMARFTMVPMAVPALAQSGLSGPVTHVASHQQIQETCNA
jgi:hypothetical protein